MWTQKLSCIGLVFKTDCADCCKQAVCNTNKIGSNEFSHLRGRPVVHLSLDCETTRLGSARAARHDMTSADEICAGAGEKDCDACKCSVNGAAEEVSTAYARAPL